MSVQAPVSDPELGERLAAATLQLVNIPSVSGDEAAILDSFAAAVPRGLQVVDREDGVVFAVPPARREGAPFVVLAGHVDTVPHQGNFPGVRDADGVTGRGSADMKGAIAVMLEAARRVAADPGLSDLDVGLLVFGREELPITQSALLPFLERCDLARSIDLAIVMEPTANSIQVGCLGNLNARIALSGAAAHTARPWLGRNAIHAAIEALAPLVNLAPRDVEIDGLVFREVMSVTSIEGGIAGNVVPDHAEAMINLRYAPTRTPAEAEERLAELLAPSDAEIAVIGNAPPGPVVAHNPLVERLRATGDLEVGPKQAWTPVAEFATIGVDAVNFGPGEPQYAHRDDERIEVASLVRCYRLMQSFLGVEEREG